VGKKWNAAILILPLPKKHDTESRDQRRKKGETAHTRPQQITRKTKGFGSTMARDRKGDPTKKELPAS